MKVKWFTPESIDGERTWSQHTFMSATRKTPYIGEEYEGNRMLCNSRRGIDDEDELFMNFNKIEPEKFNENRVCKKCLKIYNKLIKP